MPRPLLILIVAVVALLAALVLLSTFDREVTVTHVERPLSNAAQP